MRVSLWCFFGSQPYFTNPERAPSNKTHKSVPTLHPAVALIKASLSWPLSPKERMFLLLAVRLDPAATCRAPASD